MDIHSRSRSRFFWK